MKNLLLLAIVILGITSCKKRDDFNHQIRIDVIKNGSTHYAVVNGIHINPGEAIVTPHLDTINIQSCVECLLNINGGIYYDSGIYPNSLFKKGYLSDLTHNYWKYIG